jgi:HD-GYP domain-containing protein (c-di-GMP phosphodiesterase class II)
MFSKQEKPLETMSFDYLYEGLVTQDDIYNHSGKLLLVAKGIMLNDVMLKRLKKFNDLQQNIKVSPKLRGELVNRGLPQKLKQRDFENKTGYTSVKNEAGSLLTVAQITNSVPYEQAHEVGSSVLGRIDTTDPAVIIQWINAHNEIDEYLTRHSANVAFLNGLMGKWLHLDEKEVEELVLLGLLHDIGKTRIPPNILNSPQSLTDAEFAVVKKHPLYSYEMLSRSGRFPETISKGVRHHHENMDGSGYPDGLRGDGIPLYSRVLAINNTYDAMVSERTYKHAESPFKVLLHLRIGQFSGLDHELVKLFEQHIPGELIGKPVLMSDGSAGIVRFINERDIEYPIVEIDGKIVTTTPDLYCVSMIIDEIPEE